MPNNSEQKKARDRQTIQEIFDNILRNLQQTPIPTNQIAFYNYQIGNLNLYKDALINEVNACETTCDHPIRAAFALEKLHNSSIEEFDNNLKNFKIQSQHSGFYPNTRKAATRVTYGLLSAGAIALTVLVSGWFAILAVPFCLRFLDKLATTNKDYSEIYAAKEKSKAVYEFYSLFRRPPTPTAAPLAPPAYEDNKPPLQQYQPYIPNIPTRKL